MSVQKMILDLQRVKEKNANCDEKFQICCKIFVHGECNHKIHFPTSNPRLILLQQCTRLALSLENILIHLSSLGALLIFFQSNRPVSRALEFSQEIALNINKLIPAKKLRDQHLYI